MSRSPSRTYHVQPQRATGRGWQDCLDHQAERWAVIETTYWQRGQQSAQRARIVERHELKRLADVRRDELARAAKPLPKPALGQRFRSTGRTIIARSLSYEQYHSGRVK